MRRHWEKSQDERILKKFSNIHSTSYAGMCTPSCEGFINNHANMLISFLLPIINEVSIFKRKKYWRNDTHVYNLVISKRKKNGKYFLNASCYLSSRQIAVLFFLPDFIFLFLIYILLLRQLIQWFHISYKNINIYIMLPLW